MEKKVDARGLPCPEPVVRTKKALEEVGEGTVTVIVDRAAARDNVVSFAENAGCRAEVSEEKEGTFRIKIVKEKAVEEGVACEPGGKNTVIFLNTDRIGQGEQELGKVLMKAFSFALAESKTKPQALVLMNNGVKLIVEGSEFLENLSRLEKSGVRIMVCGTCLDYYGLSDKVKAGSVSNMYDITETFLAADKVVTI